MNNMIGGIAGYQKATQAYKTGSSVKTEKTYAKADVAAGKADQNVKTTTFKPVEKGSSLIPKAHEQYGVTIGNANLSEKAADYYDKLKSKFGDMDFILVSKDMKAQVAANAALYGNANKPVVLIDEEKLERMATDESFRKRYEGIIEMSKAQLAQAKTSFASSGVGVKNFGVSVDEKGNTTFFDTVEKKTTAKKTNGMKERLEKSAAKKKADKAKAEKAAKKKAEEARLDKLHDKKAKETEDDEDIEYDESIFDK
ncbi:MAG: hypothetical protein J6Z02_03500, partial [Lachnospiraceae bacterium]|nr:hypothetical protein [Lachnospiraceae bacterium]